MINLSAILPSPKLFYNLIQKLHQYKPFLQRYSVVLVQVKHLNIPALETYSELKAGMKLHQCAI